jgi:hypothetical protein
MGRKKFASSDEAWQQLTADAHAVIRARDLGQSQEEVRRWQVETQRTKEEYQRLRSQGQ